LNDATSKWLALAFYWTAYQYRAQRASLQHRGRHLTDKRSHLSTDNAENLLILKKICLNFELAATLNNVNLID